MLLLRQRGSGMALLHVRAAAPRRDGTVSPKIRSLSDDEIYQGSLPVDAMDRTVPVLRTALDIVSRTVAVCAAAIVELDRPAAQVGRSG